MDNRRPPRPLARLLGSSALFQRFPLLRRFQKRGQSRPKRLVVSGAEQLEARLPLAADFLSFGIADASGDDSALTVFESSAITLDYDLDVVSGDLLGVDLYAREDDAFYKLGEFSGTTASNQLVNLDGYSTLAGTQEIFAVANTSDGISTISPSLILEVLPAATITGDYEAETFLFSNTLSPGSIYHGGGGTDTLFFGFDASAVASLNGAAVGSHVANSMISSQAIYDGTAFDYLRLNDGREIYFQGIERLQFNGSSGSSVTELQTRTNDPRFTSQWDLTIGDVTDAWRFTRGSDDVLLVSLDTGITQTNPANYPDISSNRLSFFGNANGSDHGYQAVSVMASTPNNGQGIAGLNWESPVLVLDVYGPENVGINTAIQAGLDHLDSISATRVVYQGGIQGEYWLNILQQFRVADNTDKALFAIAAGNGGQDIAITSHPDGLSGGMARLEGTYDNVMAIGALQYNSTTVHGQRNASNVFLAGYSNFGPNLTFAAPTNVPSTRPDGGAGTFTGTSAANPVMAGYASLVWSANPELEAGEVRQLLAETVTDVGAAGRDNTFGHGIPNVGAAVRQSWALAEHHAIATIAANPFADVEPEEIPVDLNATEYHYDLGTLSSPLEASYDLLTTTSSPFATWTGSVQSSDRDYANALERDFFHSSQSASLEHRISNGIWDVTISTGDADSARDNLSVEAEGLVQIEDLDTALGEFAERTFRVRVEDGQLSLTLSDLGGDTTEWVLNRLSFEKVSDLPGYAGDFDANSMVEVEDLSQWADEYGTDGAADANLDRAVSGFDFLAWQQTLGAGVITRTTLIDGSLGNGSFEDQTDAVGLLVDPLKHRVYTNNSATASIDGWTATVSNGIGGWDGELVYVASDGNAYALANDSAVVTFTSDVFTSHSVAEGDSVNVTVDVGSSNGVAHDYQAQIVLGANTYDLGTISDGTLVSGGAGESLNTISFSHAATAADEGHHPQLILTIENQGGSSKAYLDNVQFEVVSVAGVPGGSGSQSSVAAAVSAANEAVAAKAIELSAARVALPLEQPIYFNQGVAGETVVPVPRVPTLESLTMLASEGASSFETAEEDALSDERNHQRYELPLQLRFSEHEWLDLAQSHVETGILTKIEAPHEYGRREFCRSADVSQLLDEVFDLL